MLLVGALVMALMAVMAQMAVMAVMAVIEVHVIAGLTFLNAELFRAS